MDSYKEPIPRLGLDFNKEVDYRPLVDKNGLSLPSMYTMIVERVRLSRLVEERKRLDEIQKKNNPELAAKKYTKRSGEASEWLKERLNDFEVIDLTKNTTSNKNLPAKAPALRSIANFNKSTLTSTKTTTAIVPSNISNRPPIMQSPIIISNDFGKILNNSTNNSNPIITSNGLPFSLPANFQGTIMIQPTIHIHTQDQYITNKYRQIMPKGGVIPNKKRKK